MKTVSPRANKKQKQYMQPIQIIMTISAMVAISAGIPQMVKLVKTKSSDEFNLSTWMMWIITQTVSTAYAFSLGDKLLICINIAWVTFYATMTGLIIRYSRKARKEIVASLSIETPRPTSSKPLQQVD